MPLQLLLTPVARSFPPVASTTSKPVTVSSLAFPIFLSLQSSSIESVVSSESSKPTMVDPSSPTKATYHASFNTSMSSLKQCLLPPKISKATLPHPDLRPLVDQAKQLHKTHLATYFCTDHSPPAYIVCAPGRVNLIGEHTDYTGGYVLPFAIDKWVAVYATGFLHTGKGHAPTTAKLRMVSSHYVPGAGDADASVVVEERTLSASDNYEPPSEEEAAAADGEDPNATDAAEPSEPPTTTPGPLTWPTYVVGTVAQYMPDLPSEGCVLELSLAFASNLPVGAGLSSSAALEVATATLLECFFKDDLAYSSLVDDDLHLDRTVVRALRCQKAENDWANSPCGIMDQFASSAAQSGQLMLIDCRSMEVSHVPMKTGPDQPVILVTNSQVGHEIADSEYGLRRKECNDALQAMQQVPLYHVLSLRDATLQDVDTAKEIMGETAFHRAKHVVTENSRTMECKTALKLGLWERVGELMNASHKSLKEEYEVSCDEVNFLVDICQDHPGVYGSRITGGGFGGCIVTLVQKEHVHDLIEKLQNDYKEVLGKECDSFITHPSFGSTVLAIDMDFKP